MPRWNNPLPGRSLGLVLLAIWLILTGLLALMPALGGLGVLLPLLAIAAGVLLLLGR